MNFRLLKSVLKKNFLKKKLPLLAFFFLNFFNFFLFLKTIESLLEAKTLILNFFLKKRFFFLFILTNLRLNLLKINEKFFENLYKNMYKYIYKYTLLYFIINYNIIYFLRLAACFNTYFVNPGSKPTK